MLEFRTDYVKQLTNFINPMQYGSLNRYCLDRRRIGLLRIHPDIQREKTDHKQKNAWCCNICTAPICFADDRVLVLGDWVHAKTNPAGQKFEFGCFGAAAGAERHGQLTSDYSWFRAYQWQTVHCRSCNTQLGWYFVGPSCFYGLILLSLRECKGNL